MADAYGRDFLNALRFLTVLPLPSNTQNRPGDLARSMFFFPAAGLLIAAVSYVFFTAALHVFPPRIAFLILLAAPVVITGGLHLDGFADSCDGFFGGKNKEDMLRIMKDPRLGSWGVLGMVLLILSKYELLQVMPSAAVFFLALAASRWSQVALSCFLPYAGTGGGLGEEVAGKTGFRELAGATFFMLLPVFWMPKNGLIILVLLLPVLFLLGLYFKKKIGGVTGDLFGAAGELAEVFVLLAASGLAHP